MQHKHGEERGQMFMFSLESGIAHDSLRVVDVFSGLKNKRQAAASGIM